MSAQLVGIKAAAAAQAIFGNSSITYFKSPWGTEVRLEVVCKNGMAYRSAMRVPRDEDYRPSSDYSDHMAMDMVRRITEELGRAAIESVIRGYFHV